MEEGTWVEYEGMRAWVSSWHLVDAKRLQLQELWEQKHALRAVSEARELASDQPQAL